MLTLHNVRANVFFTFWMPNVNEHLTPIQRAHVTKYELDEPANYYVLTDNAITDAAVFAITHDGDLRHVATRPGNGYGRTVMELANTLGAKTLETFDTNQTFYEHFGWHVTERYPFDPAMQPHDWKPEYGTPDYLVMARDM